MVWCFALRIQRCLYEKLSSGCTFYLSFGGFLLYLVSNRYTLHLNALKRGFKMNHWDKPCAAHGLTSYRYKGRYGWIMIGAKDNANALKEAQRSTRDEVKAENLQIWNQTQYTGVL
jgi:hypothetical protein